MVVRSDCKIDEHNSVTCHLMSAPSAARGQFLKRSGNVVWIASAIESHRFQYPGYHTAVIRRDYATAGIADSLVPFENVTGSECLPVLLKYRDTRFALVDLFAAAECERCLHSWEPWTSLEQR